ncbi:macro domain-containing protein [Flavobacterium sp. N1736]|uniref:macro domain-containing protein n=1 Tax=Flavobacterium sp. N1736 TaxID=2986823 RepID=UPI002224A074|nr:macro domain-containing protein [Flavobacterium sp. N1736]
MISYIEFGNIFKLEGVTSFAHGCNCAGAMGKGIALQFKQKYPKMYLEYNKLCKEGQFSLGDLLTYKHENEVIFNLGTQKTWRTNADISAIESSLNKMLLYASKNNIFKIALPKIGAGLGGLNWSDVKSTIEKVAQKYPKIDLFVVENYKE